MAIYASLFDAGDQRLEQVLVAIFVKYRESRDEYVNLLKFIDSDALAEMLTSYFGVTVADPANLDSLWDSVFVTYFKSTVSEDIDFGRFKNFSLPQLGNVRIFVNDLMRLHPEVFEAFSVESNNTYGLDRLLAGRELTDFVDSDAIPEIDDLVISEMIKLLANKEDISEYLRSRETSFYYTSKRPTTVCWRQQITSVRPPEPSCRLLRVQTKTPLSHYTQKNYTR